MRPSDLRPACPAKERLRRWLPDPTNFAAAVEGLPVGATVEDLLLIRSTAEYAWADATLEVYGSGLLAFHVLCDERGIPEGERAPVRDVTLQLFIATLAGAYNGDTIRNYVYGVRAWHILHGVPWSRNKAELDTLIRAALRLTPPALQRLPRLPWTTDFLRAIHPYLDVTSALGAAVWACAVVGFFSLARLGELTVTTLQDFRASKHVTRAHARQEVDRQGLAVWTIHIPVTKASASGEDITFAQQDGVVDPEAALLSHFRVNNPNAQQALFAYGHVDKKHRKSLRPLTKTCFLKAIRSAAQQAGVEVLQGHGMRIGGTLEYLLRGVPFDVVKTMGRWQSDAFTLYLRKHAQILAPYLQRESNAHAQFVRYTMPPVR